MENVPVGIIERLDVAEKKIYGLKSITIDTTQNEIHREKITKKRSLKSINEPQDRFTWLSIR